MSLPLHLQAADTNARQPVLKSQSVRTITFVHPDEHMVPSLVLPIGARYSDGFLILLQLQLYSKQSFRSTYFLTPEIITFYSLDKVAYGVIDLYRVSELSVLYF